MPQTILVADNEPEILRFVEVNLRLEGYAVLQARDGTEALEIALGQRPDLVVLDVMMPGMDGFEVCRQLRADPRTAQVPVIFLTAKSMTADKVVGLTAGADDYVLKPFDPVELVARVRTTLRRTAELRAIAPLTGLPGNHQISTEIIGRLARGSELAVVYADVDHFKSFNDRYGFLRGDGVILKTAEILDTALAEHAGADAFLGHVGGDDFVLLCHPRTVAAVCRRAIDDFDRVIADSYDLEDAKAGYLEMADRQGELRRFPLMSLSLGVATNEHRDYRDHREMVAVATEMKAFCKRQPHASSSYAIDERREDEPAAV